MIMKVISTTQELEAFCNKAKAQPFITLDTEFLSGKTYYPQLCLIQIALPENYDLEYSACVIDALSPKLHLGVLNEILLNPDIMKVFHSAKQDLEIFWQVFGEIPKPLFDTQIAAMLCGYGSQVSYSNLVKDICGINLDKSQQFSNWSTRPLKKRQLNYAVSDVTYLREIYTDLKKKLLETQRLEWVEDLISEMIETCKTSYKPEEAWKKIKTKNITSEGWSILFALAEFREIQAQTRNLPRRRVLTDHALLEMVSVKPRTIEELKECRFFNIGKNTQNRFTRGLLEVINKAITTPIAPPQIVHTRRSRKSNKDITDLLKVYLKYSSEQSGVAEELISTADELREISLGNLDVRPLKGWRKKLFGDNALKLCRGKVALTIKNSKLAVVEN